jgi:hypothetical protein
MHLTRAGSMQRTMTSGPKGWSVGPTLQPLMCLLHGHALQEVVTRNLKLEVDGSWARWPASYVARSVGQHKACY